VISSLVKKTRQVFHVHELTRDLKNLIEENFHSVWIQGEVSNFKVSAAGHIYFTLKDDQAQLSAVLFKGFLRLIKFEIEDGMALVVHGKLSVYETRGQYQIIIDHAEPDGIGALQLAFEQLKNKLAAEGFFDTDRKRALPFLPRRIGIVTSLQGAVLHDMMTILKRRQPRVDILIYPVKVQGDGAAEEIAQAITYFSDTKLVDVVIVGRGGGSLEDLWAFNEEIVARAVASCAVPVVSAVGHETDFSICDFVADVRAPTPSAAAELCVPVLKDLEVALESLKSRLTHAIQQDIIRHKKELFYFIKTLPTPRDILDNLQLKLGDHENQLQRLWERCLTEKKHRHETLITKLKLLSPQNTLERGYVIVKDLPSQRVLTRKKMTRSGEDVTLNFSDGTVKATIL
jgi:exodeoxyribonuclease VII large subunit